MKNNSILAVYFSPQLPKRSLSFFYCHNLYIIHKIVNRIIYLIKSQNLNKIKLIFYIILIKFIKE